MLAGFDRPDDRSDGSAMRRRGLAELVLAEGRIDEADPAASDAREPLTAVAELAAEGKTNKEIAQALYVTPKTVEVHLSNSYRKLDISSRRQLAGALGE